MGLKRFFMKLFWCPKCYRMVNEQECPHWDYENPYPGED